MTNNAELKLGGENDENERQAKLIVAACCIDEAKVAELVDAVKVALDNAYKRGYRAAFGSGTNQEEINVLAAEFNLTPEGNEPELFAKSLSLCQKFKKEKDTHIHVIREMEKALANIKDFEMKNDSPSGAIYKMREIAALSLAREVLKP